MVCRFGSLIEKVIGCNENNSLGGACCRPFPVLVPLPHLLPLLSRGRRLCRRRKHVPWHRQARFVSFSPHIVCVCRQRIHMSNGMLIRLTYRQMMVRILLQGVCGRPPVLLSLPSVPSVMPPLFCCPSAFPPPVTATVVGECACVCLLRGFLSSRRSPSGTTT